MAPLRDDVNTSDTAAWIGATVVGRQHRHDGSFYDGDAHALAIGGAARQGDDSRNAMSDAACMACATTGRLNSNS